MTAPTTLKRPLLLAAALVLGLSVASCGGDDPGQTESTPSETTETSRQADVAERGAAVMPFDLDATTHRFTPTDDGLVEDVTADDPDDGNNITLIREHLLSERDRFSAGDYGDPTAIHGSDMPGLDELDAGAANIEIEYTELTDGVRLTFSSDDAARVDALHRWGAAQVTDHGAHAES